MPRVYDDLPDDEKVLPINEDFEKLGNFAKAITMIRTERLPTVTSGEAQEILGGISERLLQIEEFVKNSLDGFSK